MCARAKGPEHEVPEPRLVEDLVGVLGVALERSALDEAGCRRGEERSDAREEEELDAQREGCHRDWGGGGPVRVDRAIDDGRVREVDFDVHRGVEGDDTDHDSGLGEAECQDCAARDLEEAHGRCE